MSLKTQNIYGTADALTEERTRGARFSGCWIELKPSHRLDPCLIPILQDYTEDFLRKEKSVPPPRNVQGNIDLGPVELL